MDIRDLNISILVLIVILVLGDKQILEMFSACKSLKVILLMHYIIICSIMQNLTNFHVSKVHFAFETRHRYINLTWKCRS